jgi:hypothetical protein
VNTSTGNDSNPGTSASPFKTITRALSFAVGRDTVFVKPGTYSVGETFPLQVPAGVNLIGDEPNRGASTGAPVKIAGNVTMGANSTLAGFTVTTSTGSGVTLATANVAVRNNTITGNNTNIAVLVSSSTNHLIALNAITNNASIGIYSATAATGKVENNTITGNQFIGIEYDAAGGDLGGGSFGSVGNNILSCNTNTDFWTNIAGTVNANNNKWDHVPPTQSSTALGNGLDLYFSTATTVTTAGAALAPNPCPACSASAVSSQVFDGIMIGCGAAVSFANRATLCPSYCHVCGANEWLAHRGTLAPAHNYWTNDLLGYSSPTCFSTSGPTFCGSLSPPQGPGGVCAPTQPDPEGNMCNSPNHALCPDTTSNQFFGGCNGLISGVAVDRSGALCCCP